MTVIFRMQQFASRTSRIQASSCDNRTQYVKAAFPCLTLTMNHAHAEIKESTDKDFCMKTNNLVM
ncbi:hypothetical protein T06_12400 [Trichinella sp. T6]|nr:hypothetical protein T06_12400 [Trichinella sp. T6]